VQEQATVFAASRRDGGRTRAFRAGLARIVIAKEWRLIARDPTLIAKSLVQLLYFVPLILILARHAQLAGFLAASLVMLASSLAGTLAWITVSGEEAPDLVGSAPIEAERVRWLKAAAALVPVAVVVIPFLAWYAAHSLRLFAILVPFVAAGVVSSAVIQVWAGRPAQARDLGARNRQDPLMNTVEASAAFGWALACYLAAAGYYAAAVPAAAFGFAGPAVAWFVGRARAGTL
jgi:ABC-2 type transport system permease protein